MSRLSVPPTVPPGNSKLPYPIKIRVEKPTAVVSPPVLEPPMSLGELASSSQKVYAALTQPMQSDGIHAATGIPKRTIRFCLKQLTKNGYVQIVRGIKDARIVYWKRVK